MGRAIWQYKYLSGDAEWLPKKSTDLNHIPSADETSSIKIDYFQSIGGPDAYASLVDGGVVAVEGMLEQWWKFILLIINCMYIFIRRVEQSSYYSVK